MFITEAMWEDYRDAYRGFCIKCQAWTTDNVEPDATGIVCSECRSNTVLGAEEVLISGELILLDAEDSNALGEI